MSNTILVLGATGKTGKRVAERLAQLNIPVRIGSRNASPAFDWNNEHTWKAVLRDIEQVYITFQPDLAIPGTADKISAFVKHAKRARVKKLVLLSGRGEREAEASEREVMNSGLDWTIVRANWLMQNFSESFFLNAVLSGQLYLPQIKALEPFVDVDDIADVVVAALTQEQHNGNIYTTTGPELLSFEKVATIISETTGRPVQVHQVGKEEYLTMLRDLLIPENFIWLIDYLFTEMLDGRNESLTGDIEKVLKRKPCSFEAYAKKANASGVWDSRVNYC
jgi:uncharacterized protein YbjT (DUF2867 family)